MSKKDGKYQVPAVVGAIKVLEILSGPAEQGATQTALVEATGLSKSTMHNLLSTLEAHKFVRREESTKTYRLGSALIPLGTAATRQVKLIRSTVDRLEETGELLRGVAESAMSEAGVVFHGAAEPDDRGV